MLLRSVGQPLGVADQPPTNAGSHGMKSRSIRQQYPPPSAGTTPVGSGPPPSAGAPSAGSPPVGNEAGPEVVEHASAATAIPAPTTATSTSGERTRVVIITGCLAKAIPRSTRRVAHSPQSKPGEPTCAERDRAVAPPHVSYAAANAGVFEPNLYEPDTFWTSVGSLDRPIRSIAYQGSNCVSCAVVQLWGSCERPNDSFHALTLFQLTVMMSV